jgi:hypothetical protein
MSISDRIRVWICKLLKSHHMTCLYEGVEGTTYECMTCGYRVDEDYPHHEYDHVGQ